MELEEARKQIDFVIGYCRDRYIGSVQFGAETSVEPILVLSGDTAQNFLIAIQTVNEKRESEAIDFREELKKLTQALKDFPELLR